MNPLYDDVLFAIEIGYKLSHPRVLSHGLDKDDLRRIQPHAFRGVPLTASFEQCIVAFASLRVDRGLNVVNVSHYRVRRSVSVKSPEKYLAIGEEHCLVLGTECDRLTGGT